MDLQRKIDFAIKLLQSIPQDGPIELSYSGGKDSDVILELAKMAGIPFEAIYKNTTIDPPGTIKHCKDNGVTILKPKMSFLQLVEKYGTPSRWTRFCCSYLKEYKIYDRNIIGIRKSESTKRAKRYKEPEQCRVYKNGERVRIYLPILEWTDDDVERFITERGIKCAPVYYDERGNFKVERRLGCIGCPLATQGKRREQYAQYPKLLKAIIQRTNVFYNTHNGRTDFPDVYHKFFCDLFFRTRNDYLTFVQGSLFETDFDAKSYLEKYFKIEL